MTTVDAFFKALEKAHIRKLSGATSLARIEKRTQIPPLLAELWRRSDGLEEGCFFDPDSEEIEEEDGLHFLTVGQAASEMLTSPRPREGVVFGSDLGGTLLVAIGPTGAVKRWDHESGELEPVARTFDAFLKRCTRALKKRGAIAAAPPATPLQLAVKAMFERALSNACRERAIWLINQPQARGGPARDEAWCFRQLAAMLTQVGDAAFVREQAVAAGQKL